MPPTERHSSPQTGQQPIPALHGAPDIVREGRPAESTSWDLTVACVDRLLRDYHQWAIGDEVEREGKVSDAPDAELAELVRVFDSLPESLFDWLGSPDSPQRDARRYGDVSDIVMALEYAKAELGSRADSGRGK